MGVCSGVEVATLVFLFRVGFPVVGRFAAPGVYPMAGGSRGIPDDPLLGAREKWEELPRLFAREENTELLWESALRDVQRGWLRPPVPMDALGRDNCLPVRRFGVPQGDKVRPCDNCRRSGTNTAAAVETPIVLPTFEDLLVAASLIRGMQRPPFHRPCGFFKSDHADAYRQVPIAPAHARFCVVTLKCPHSGRIMCFEPRTLLFGSTTAVLGYNLVARVVATLFTRFFRLPLLNYFDDFAGCCPPEVLDLAQVAFTELNDFLGFRCNYTKEECGPEINFLGLRCCVEPLSASLPHDTRGRS